MAPIPGADSLKLFALIILYFHLLKGLFYPSHQDSFLYIHFFYTHTLYLVLYILVINIFYSDLLYPIHLLQPVSGTHSGQPCLSHLSLSIYIERGGGDKVDVYLACGLLNSYSTPTAEQG